CASYPSTTICSTESCDPSGSTHTKPGTCATGSCSADTELCDPFMCGTNGKCRGSCTTKNDCTPGHYCSGGTCVDQKDKGSMCDGPDECGTGNCVEHVCCGSGACGQCESCALPGQDKGTCTAVPGGTFDPSGTCKDQGMIGCGTTGKCDDFKHCAY